MQLLFEHSAAWLLLLLPLAALLSFGLYFYRPSIKNKSLRTALASLRFVSLVILCILLLAPLFERQEINAEKPKIVVLQDASSSMLNYSDSTSIKALLSRWLSSTQESEADFDWHYFSFDKGLTEGMDTSFKGGSTNYSDNFKLISERFAGRKPAAMVLISDGNFNRGMNPLIAADQLAFPIFTVGVGDTLSYPDIRIAGLRHNEISYLDNQFPLKVYIESDNMNNYAGKVSVYSNGKVLSSKPISLKNASTAELDFLLDAKRVGFEEYQVVIEKAANEKNVQNNSSSFRVDVLDSKKKILLLAAAPHPDLRAIRHALQGMKNLELEVKLIGDRVDLNAYQALILHQIPAISGKDDYLFQQIANMELPKWYILGQQSDLRAFNRIQGLMSLQLRSNQFDDVRPDFNDGFTSFTSPEGIGQALAFSPPLKAPFGDYQLNAAADVLAYQKIGSVRANRPLWLNGADKGQKLMITTAEGIWRWPLYLEASNSEKTLFEQLVEKAVQLLSSDMDKDRFRLQFPRQIEENEAFNINAELYNQAFEKVVGPALKIQLKDEKGREYEFLFNQLETSYSLKVPALAPSIYQFTASVNLGGEELKKTGRFFVKASKRESNEIVANHQLLKELSEKTNAKYYPLNRINKLQEDLQTSSFAKPILYAQKQLTALIESKILLPLLLLFFSLEWLLRKRYGKY